jgi:glycosyltransferase involved in cell wall biosynthesis
VWKEKRLLRESDEVILITEDFLPLMAAWGIDRAKLHVLHNWTPIEDVPVSPKDSAWSRRHGLADKFCFLYTGTLGLKHDPAILLDLALAFKEVPEVEVVVISEGLGAEWLLEQKRARSVDNLKILDFQPFTEMPYVLGAADVLVAVLEPDAGVYSAPSKVLTYLCAERALLLAVPPENLSARVVAEHHAGLVVHPSQRGEFLEAAQRLFSNSQLRSSCATNARKFAEQSFDIGKIGDRFEEIIGLPLR